MAQSNIIKLKFSNTESGLAGNNYGRSVYAKQVKPTLNLDELNIIKFPDNITQVASSFVQGFFADVVKEVGYEKVRQHIVIDSPYEYLVKGIMEDLVI